MWCSGTFAVVFGGYLLGWLLREHELGREARRAGAEGGDGAPRSTGTG